MLTILVGGFFGDEGKGKIIGAVSLRSNPDIIVRAGGGPQAGHTVSNGMKVTQIPSGFINKDARLLIARGTVIDTKAVLDEIKKYGVENRIGIDFGCTIIKPEHIERELELKERIGSVGRGVGPAREDRILRYEGLLAKDDPELKPYLCDVAQEVIQASLNGQDILVEGVQGYGLSLLNHQFYPYVTSQDTTASQFAADIGIGPKFVDEVLIVYKAYISRVGKGPMGLEWTDKQKKEYGIEERGTVSGRSRRLGDFNIHLAIESLLANSATIGAITCLDRLFKGNEGVQEFDALTYEAKKFVIKVNHLLQIAAPFFKGIGWLSTGPDSEHLIDTRNILLK